MKKMILILLLFITLTCSVCETFEVRAAQRSYQVSKNENVTLEWTFTNSSLDSLQIDCFVFTEPLLNVQFFDNRHTIPLFLFEKKGVRFDRELIREGRFSLHVSSLRTEDSGCYSCKVQTSVGSGEASCTVFVTEPPTAGNGGWICFDSGLLSTLISACVVVFLHS